MIKKVDDFNPVVHSLISENMMQNPYLYIDVQTYGYTSENVQTSVFQNEECISVILLDYYNTMQTMQIVPPDEILLQEIIDYILLKKPVMISGTKELLVRIIERLQYVDIESKDGAIIDMTGMRRGYSQKTNLATPDQLKEVAKLICSDYAIGGHYTIEGLHEQLLERNIFHGCINRIAICDGKIVAHFATYADMKPISVMGGLITEPSYRGRGLAKTVLGDLVEDILEKEKRPLLYTYEDSLIDWYLSLGGQKCCDCSKLELRYKD